jgi:16S rRNA G966 N2-methylase RsmD
MLNLKSFIVNGELIIDKPHWYQLKNSHDRQELKDAISDAIEGLELPLVEITEEEAKQDFDKLVKFDAKTLLNKGSLYTKANYKYKLSHWYLQNSGIGRKSTNYFHQLARWKVGHQKHISPYRSWTEKKIHQTFLNPLWTLDMLEVNNKTLRSAIQMRMYMASQYPPAVAKAIYTLFEAKDILDFSMGWGDRLAGFHSSNAKSYTGIDPNQEVFDKYPKQNELYKTGKSTEFIKAPAEDVDLSNRKFDMIFTSPPYFHLEKYSADENQSWKRYGKNIDQWLEKFLFTTLNKSWDSLKDGGTMIINIADVYSGDNKYEQICDPMNDFISKLPDANYSGCIGLKLSKRPQSNNDNEDSKGKKVIEPMWIWKKGDTRTLDQIIDDTSPLSKFFS